jgi:CheY-like chemotaxis protein
MECSMPNETTAAAIAETIGTNLPLVRRYARALTGSQAAGDRHAAEALEAVLRDDTVFDRAIDPKLALFKVFHGIWHCAGAPSGEAESDLAAAAQRHLARLTPNSREVLLLSAIEGFTAEQIGRIIGHDERSVEELLATAYLEMQASVTGQVMIIEDESLIAMDLKAIVRELGHDVTGIARTRSAAVTLASEKEPDLILADINLADNSSGIDAVAEILGDLGHRPVIFITAYPERLLTGERHEPAFMIAKPYTEEQVRVAVSQAMFFASTSTLEA